MKRTSVCKAFWTIVLFSLALAAFGCSGKWYQQPGETAAEGHRRHLRNLRINYREMVQDIDRAMLTDQPSRLADKRMH